MKQIVRYCDTVGQKVIFKFSGPLPALEKDEEYVLEVSPVGKDRTLAQNKMMWSVIREIARQTGEDTISIYKIGLKTVGVKSEQIWAVEEAEKKLKQQFRVVDKLEKAQMNGRDGYIYEVYYGSSTFNVKEMTDLLDYFIGLVYKLQE